VTPIGITAAETHDLRRRVLRGADPDAELSWAGDDLGTTVHLGIRDDAGTIVAISTWLVRPDPFEPTRPATQLRGMATDPRLVGAGLGTRLLRAGIERCRSQGDELVWANARVSAVGFYERAGFAVVGPEFDTPDTGLPHRIVRLLIA
jgi:GNAT superfamily N-acetyltransferase